ncbi:MAG: RsmE family RNA methyltransferase, partial [Capsulimonadaceae bacterium]
MTRFFVQPEQISAGEVVLGPADAHHLHVVLHAKAGECIAVLDGTGRELTAALIEVGKTRARGRVLSEVDLGTECAVRVTVAQALPKMAEKLETVLQHGTEVGAAEFWPFTCARSQTGLTGERQQKRISRWEMIVKTAAEQSRRAVLPVVRPGLDLRGVLAGVAPFDVALLAYEGERNRLLRDALPVTPPKSVLVIVGPEGGFAPDEIRLAERSGVVPVSLGPRILRTETAALVILAQINYAFEGPESSPEPSARSPRRSEATGADITPSARSPRRSEATGAERSDGGGHYALRKESAPERSDGGGHYALRKESAPERS